MDWTYIEKETLTLSPGSPAKMHSNLLACKQLKIQQESTREGEKGELPQRAAGVGSLGAITCQLILPMK
jgi:hypothetical protein